jgi:hypothetical protein
MNLASANQTEMAYKKYQKSMRLSAVFASFSILSAILMAVVSNTHLRETVSMQLKTQEKWIQYYDMSGEIQTLSIRLDLARGPSAIPFDLEQKIKSAQSSLEALKMEAQKSEVSSLSSLQKSDLFFRSLLFFLGAALFCSLMIQMRKGPYLLVGISFYVLGLIFFVVGLKT